VVKKFFISQKDFAENFACYVQSPFPFFLALLRAEFMQGVFRSKAVIAARQKTRFIRF
jgi:hypothetical protein